MKKNAGVIPEGIPGVIQRLPKESQMEFFNNICEKICGVLPRAIAVKAVGGTRNRTCLGISEELPGRIPEATSEAILNEPPESRMKNSLGIEEETPEKVLEEIC